MSRLRDLEAVEKAIEAAYDANGSEWLKGSTGAALSLLAGAVYGLLCIEMERSKDETEVQPDAKDTPAK